MCTDLVPDRFPLTLADWTRLYAEGASPRLLVERFGRAAEAAPADPAWIKRADRAELQAQIAAIEAREAACASRAAALLEMPLYGVPYAVKDNIDVQHWGTSAACPTFVRVAEQDAHVVARLAQAGAVCVGKTNLDQFATGLVGTRSPYGRPSSTFNPQYVSGGSSSGSAVVVSRGDEKRKY